MNVRSEFSEFWPFKRNVFTEYDFFNDIVSRAEEKEEGTQRTSGNCIEI